MYSILIYSIFLLKRAISSHNSCAKIVQIKILHDNECKKNAHHTYTYSQLASYTKNVASYLAATNNCSYKTCSQLATKFKPKTACNLKCLFFIHKNNIQTMQNLYNQLTEMAFIGMFCVHQLQQYNAYSYIQNLYNKVVN